MGGNKKIFVNTAILYIRVVITLIVSLLSTRYVLKALGETDFGLYNLIAGVVTLLSFLSTSLSSSTQRFISYEKGRSNDIEAVKRVFECSVSMHFWTGIALFVIISIGGSLLINYVLNIPTGKGLDAYIVLLSVSIGMVLTVFNVPYDAVLMAHENIVFYAICQLTSVIIRLLIAIVLTFVGGNHLILFAIITSFIPVLLYLFERYYCVRHYAETKETQLCLNLHRNPLAKQMGSFMSYTLLGAMGWTVRTQGYSMIINIFWGVLMNAANGIATQVSNAITTFSTSLTTSIRPQLVQSIAAKDIKRSSQLLDWSCKFPIILVSVLTIPVFIMLPYIMKIWLTEVPAYTVTFCRCLLIALLVNQSTLGLAISLDAYGRIKQLHLLVGGSLIACTILAYIFCALGKGPIYIYVLLIVNNIIISLIRIILTAIYGGLDISHFIYKTILPPSLIGIFTTPIIYYIWDAVTETPYNLFLTAAISTIIYLSLTWFLLLSRDNRKHIINKFSNFVNKNHE